MREYELVIVVKPSLSDQLRKKVMDAVKSWIKDVKVTSENEWGVKAFSYPIKKEVSGFYTLLHLEGETMPLDFEKRILAHDQILRHLLVRKK